MLMNIIAGAGVCVLMAAMLIALLIAVGRYEDRMRDRDIEDIFDVRSI